MSSRRSSTSSFDDLDFERISSPESESVEHSCPSPRREESPVLVEATDVMGEEESEIHRLRALLTIREVETQNLKVELEKSGFLVTRLLRQLEEEKSKQFAIESEKNRLEQVLAENLQLKEAVEKLEKLSLHERIKIEMVDEVKDQEIREEDQKQEIQRLRAEIERRDVAKLERRARKDEMRKKLRRSYEPYPILKTQQQLTDELKLADQQIGIIVEHNDYLRTIEANEHSRELCRLKAENEELHQTICFLKQQLI